MRDTFVKVLTELAVHDPRIELITGDLGFGVLKPFWERCPNQFINAGIAEQNMATLAAGMALEGKIVFTYSIGNFPTLRCLEQIRNDCAYHQANVKIVCVGGGFVYGALGVSHHATEDIAVMRALPEVLVACPGDPVEAEALTRSIIDWPGTCYLRLGRGGERHTHKKLDYYEPGRALKIRDGRDIVIFSTGAILGEVVQAVNLLEKRGLSVAQYSFPTVKPIDCDIIFECGRDFRLIVTVEEHSRLGGLGGVVAETLTGQPSKAILLRLGLTDTYTTEVGSQDYLRRISGLDAAGIARQIVEVSTRYP